MVPICCLGFSIHGKSIFSLDKFHTPQSSFRTKVGFASFCFSFKCITSDAIGTCHGN